MSGARLSTIPALSSAAAARASSALSAAGSCLAAINDHQGDDAARGLARGAMRRLPHGHVPYQFQFAGADAPWQRPVRFSSSRRTGHNFPAMRLTAAGRAFLSVRLGGSSPFAAQSVPDQPLEQLAVPVIHHLSNRLLKSSSRAGSDNASKRGQGLGNIIHELGTIIQGAGCHD